MSVSDPIADMICIIKNGGRVKKESVEFPFSKIKFDMCNVLKSEGYLSSVDKIIKNNHQYIKINLKYDDKQNNIISEMIKISTPGRRYYLNKKDIPKIKNGFGISVMSTNKGVITGKKARLNNVGGEVLCHVW